MSKSVVAAAAVNANVLQFLRNWRGGAYDSWKATLPPTLPGLARYRRAAYTTVYRGMHFPLQEVNQALGTLKARLFESKRPASWTIDRRIAEEFAGKGTYGVVMTAVIQPADVLFDITTVNHPDFKAWREEEAEVVLRPGTYPLVAVDSVNMPDPQLVRALGRAVDRLRELFPNRLRMTPTRRLLTIAPTGPGGWEVRVKLDSLVDVSVHVDLRRAPDPGLPGSRVALGALLTASAPMSRMVSIVKRLMQ